MMECRVKSASKPTANWFKDGVPVVQGAVFSAVFVDEGDQTYLCQLEIRVSFLFFSRIAETETAASADVESAETRLFLLPPNGGCSYSHAPLSTFATFLFVTAGTVRQRRRPVQMQYSQ